jgi:HD-like signal output (HDOD) protein
VINSPLFGLRNQLTSIKQALSLLGFANVINIVNSISIRDTLSEAEIVEMTSFWDNASDVATAAAMFSRSTGIANPDEAYTLGLFHNAGIPLLMEKFPDYPRILKEAYNNADLRITESENNAIGTNHSVIGYYVAKSWKLPNYLCEAIADHHKTDQIFSEEVGCENRKKNLLATLKLAETTCNTFHTLGDAQTDFEFERIKHNVLIYLGLSEYDFEDLQAEIIDQIR